MSKAFTSTEWAELRTAFEERRDKQLALVQTHEVAGSYAMAYLALWAILEFFAKRLGPHAQREELKKGLTEWLNYLEAPGLSIPSRIGVGKFDIPKIETDKIPSCISLQTLFPLEAGGSFFTAIDTKNKYRGKRNEIAHRGDMVTLKVYSEFKEVAVKALSEIESWLASRLV
jgi:hypothetical protein